MARPPKPTEVHVLEGTFREDRHGDPASAVEAPGEPIPPADLSQMALSLWKRLVPGLVASGVARERDGEELAAMCEWWARYKKVSRSLDRMAAVNGKYRDLVINAGICWDKFNSIACRFGLTPSDRVKLRGIEKPKKESGVASRKRG